MVHELLIKYSIMGLPTNVKVIFAAANPPDGYETNFIDLATASRFCLLKVPGPKDFKAKEIDKILLSESTSLEDPPPVIRDIVAKARAVKFGLASRKQIVETVRRLANDINSHKGVKFSLRQARYLVAMLEASLALKNIDFEVDLIDQISIVTSMIPEISGLVASTGVDKASVEAKIRTALIALDVGDPILSGDITTVVKGDRTDLLGWASSVISLATSSPPAETKKAMQWLKKERENIREDVFNSVFHTLFTCYLADEGQIDPSLLDRIVSPKSLSDFIKSI
jgi:hypothetical protein